MLESGEGFGEDGLYAGFVGYVEGVADYGGGFVALGFDDGFGFVEGCFAPAGEDYGVGVCLGEGYCCCSAYAAALGCVSLVRLDG